jgi:hypothetical protein
MTTASTWIGIDISKATLEVAVSPTNESWQVDRTSTGLDQLVDRLTALKPERIVLEATGGYEMLVARRWPATTWRSSLSTLGQSATSPEPAVS